MTSSCWHGTTRRWRGKGFVNWYPFEHPQLGRVELGGWDTLYTWSNPPHALLEKEIERFPKWLVWQLLISPRLELLEATAVPIGPDAWRVRLVVQNTGWLPSYVTKRAAANKLTRGVICEIELPQGARLETGKLREELGQLEGRPTSPSHPAAGRDGAETRRTIGRKWNGWCARLRGSVVRLTARHERAGTVRVELKLEGGATP